MEGIQQSTTVNGHGMRDHSQRDAAHGLTMGVRRQWIRAGNGKDRM